LVSGAASLGVAAIVVSFALFFAVSTPIPDPPAQPGPPAPQGEAAPAGGGS
jgi:hypothetical protein